MIINAAEVVTSAAFDRFAVWRKQSLLRCGYPFVGAAHTCEKLSFSTSNCGFIESKNSAFAEFLV